MIVGKPNAGKSTIINKLAKEEVAIVSDEPGTTRDIVKVLLVKYRQLSNTREFHLMYRIPLVFEIQIRKWKDKE